MTTPPRGSLSRGGHKVVPVTCGGAEQGVTGPSGEDEVPINHSGSGLMMNPLCLPASLCTAISISWNPLPNIPLDGKHRQPLGEAMSRCFLGLLSSFVQNVETPKSLLGGESDELKDMNVFLNSSTTPG